MEDEKLHNQETKLTSEEIEKLQNLCYEYGNSWLPLADFFNDIRDNKDKDYDKNQAYKDLWLIVNFVLDGFERGEKISLSVNKNVDFALIRHAKTVEEYNSNVSYELTSERELTNEEFETLKKTICPSYVTLEEKRTNALKLIFEKKVDIPQFLKSTCAKGYNCYIRATYNWITSECEKYTLTEEEFEIIKDASRYFQEGKSEWVYVLRAKVQKWN